MDRLLAPLTHIQTNTSIRNSLDDSDWNQKSQRDEDCNG